jgi:CDP-glycerol glycerophosphotransferase
MNLRNLAVAMVLRTLRVALRVLSRVVPQTRLVLVSAYPETEGNAFEVARALLQRYEGRVVWLREPGPAPKEVLELTRLELVPKASLRGLWAYLRAEVVFFTHGLYGSPRPTARKPIVNLWHGDGPKDVRPENGVGGLISSTWFVGSTQLFSGYQAAAFGIPDDHVLITGNPRTDQLWRRVDQEQLARLGVTADFVVWMPTFRRTRAVGAMREQSELTGAAEGGETEVSALLAGLRERGLQLVIKPHPMDAEERRWDGAVTITDADLVDAEVSLYELLGRSRGLVTDYSSVWVDYLLLDRPIAFLVPDRDSYTRQLLPADVLDWAPGELVGPDEPFAQFLADLDSSGADGAPLRAQVASKIGLTPTRTSADELLAALVERGVLG